MPEYRLKRCHFSAEEVEYLLALVREHERITREQPAGFMQTHRPVEEQLIGRLESYAKKACDA